MNSKQLTRIVHNVNNSLLWAEYCKDKTAKEIKEVEKIVKFKLLQGSELNKAIQSIKNFDINNVWSPEFWGLKQHESICAVATGIYNNIKRIKNENN